MSGTRTSVACAVPDELFAAFLARLPEEMGAGAKLLELIEQWVAVTPPRGETEGPVPGDAPLSSAAGDRPAMSSPPVNTIAPASARGALATILGAYVDSEPLADPTTCLHPRIAQVRDGHHVRCTHCDTVIR